MTDRVRPRRGSPDRSRPPRSTGAARARAARPRAGSEYQSSRATTTSTSPIAIAVPLVWPVGAAPRGADGGWAGLLARRAGVVQCRDPDEHRVGHDPASKTGEQRHRHHRDPAAGQRDRAGVGRPRRRGERAERVADHEHEAGAEERRRRPEHRNQRRNHRVAAPARPRETVDQHQQDRHDEREDEPGDRPTGDDLTIEEDVVGGHTDGAARVKRGDRRQHSLTDPSEPAAAQRGTGLRRPALAGEREVDRGIPCATNGPCSETVSGKARWASWLSRCGAAARTRP